MDLNHSRLKVFETGQAAKGLMSTHKLIIFKHDSAIGNAPAYTLFDRVKLTRKDANKPARDFSDYSIKDDEGNLPKDIEIIKKP